MPILRRPWSWLLIVLVLHILADLRWQRIDNQIPDGDEAGHLGAIELYRGVIADRGVVQAVLEAFTSPSEYPPVHALVNALPLAVLEPAGSFPSGVGYLNAFWSSLTVLAVAAFAYAAARPTQVARTSKSRAPSGAPSPGVPMSPGWTAVLAAAAFATFPLNAALARHTMLEPLLALWTAAAMFAAWKSRGLARVGPVIWLGCLFVAGILTKQTFVLYVVAPLCWIGIAGLRRLPGRSARGIGLLLLVSLPLPAYWFWLHWDTQGEYGIRSAAAKATVGVWTHAAYYPSILIGQGTGLLWAAPFAVALVVLVLRKQYHLVAALVLVLATLTVVPKKYPRLLAPGMPLAAVVLALGLAELRSRTWRRILVVMGVGAGSLQQAAVVVPLEPFPEDFATWTPGFLEEIDPGCTQRWIRRPYREDLGFDAIVRLLETTGVSRRADGIAFIDEPEIPCWYETTFSYTYHLREYSRRRGVELDEIPVARLDPESFVERADHLEVVVATEPWCEDPSERNGLSDDWTATQDTLDAQRQPLATGDDLCALSGRFHRAARFDTAASRLEFSLYFYVRKH